MSFPRTISDRFGNLYRLHLRSDSRMWTFSISAGGLPVGYAYCWLLGKTEGIRINDICIRDDIPVRRSPLLAFIRSLFRLPVQYHDFRRRGIGTALLRAIVAAAKANGYRRVLGEVKSHDRQRFEGLPDWYSRNGFQVMREGGRIFIARETSLPA